MARFASRANSSLILGGGGGGGLVFHFNLSKIVVSVIDLVKFDIGLVLRKGLLVKGKGGKPQAI